MVFIDSNVPMYLVGAPHPNRDRVVAFLQAQPGEYYVTSAEVYQEILHRYAAIGRRAAIADAFDLLDDLAVSVFVWTFLWTKKTIPIVVRPRIPPYVFCLP